MTVLTQTGYLVATLLDGRSIEKASCSQVVTSGMIHLTVTLTYLKSIDAVLEIHSTNESPRTTAYGPEHVTVSGNIVGFTLQAVGAGTTLYFDVVALGY